MLLCDADPQGNCTSGMGVSKDTAPGTYEILINSAEAADAVIETKYGDIIPANRNLSGANVELVNMADRESILKKALSGLKDRYDYIFIDCPPSLELITINAFCAADGVMVPVQCEYYAMEGLSDLAESIKLTRRRLNPSLEIEGIVLTMYDGRTNLSEQVAAEVRKYFGDKVYKTTIPRNVRLSEAPSHGKPVIAYDRMSKGSRAYLKLGSEFLKRQV